eukprot:10999909-Heterocapsa_arctica.AAC.1
MQDGMTSINKTLSKYQAHYASKKGIPELNAIIRLSLLVAQGTLCSRRSHYLIEGWQPAEPEAETSEYADPTLCQTKDLDDGVTIENRRSVGSLVSGSYAAGCFDPANPNWWKTPTQDPRDPTPAKVRLASSEEEVAYTL